MRVWLILLMLSAIALSIGARADSDIPESWYPDDWDRMRARLSAVDFAIAQMEDITEELDTDEQAEAVSNFAASFAFEGGNAINIRSVDSLSLDDKTQIIYGRDRTRVQSEGFTLEADRMTIDTTLREVEADGNVVLALTDSRIDAERLWFNFDTNEGIAYRSEGQITFFRFLAKRYEEVDEPSFRQMNRNEFLFTRSRFTTDDFPRPMYEIRASEVLLFPRDRIFIRNALVYSGEYPHVPLFYIPAYNKSLKEREPWHFVLGSDNELGEFFLATYQYKYYSHRPSFDDEDNVQEYVGRTYGDMKFHFDYFSSRGNGFGYENGYVIDYGKHKGKWLMYFIDDQEYEVGEEETAERYVARIGHRSRLTERLWWHFNLDWLRDPEVYYDILDQRSASDFDRERVAERSLQSSLTWLDEWWLGRVWYERRERISRDRITNYGEPGDDDSDFDTDDELREIELILSGELTLEEIEELEAEDDDDRGISPERYGLVSERLPHVTLATHWLNVFRTPHYYSAQIDIFRNLDRGLNSLSEEDDAQVVGVDVYQRWMYYLKFNDATNLIIQPGFGGGYMKRDDKSFGYDFPGGAFEEELPTGGVNPPQGFQFELSTLEWVDEETFLVGEEEFSLEDTQDDFVYVDNQTELNHRFSRSLRGRLLHFIREGTDNSLSEFYEQIGNRLARTDLYDYRLRRHYVEGSLFYTLLQPDFTARLRVRQNLDNDADLSPGEEVRTIQLALEYQTPRPWLALTNSYDLYTTQFRDPSDEFAYQGDTFRARAGADIKPLHNNWLAGVGFSMLRPLDEDPLTVLFEEEEERFFAANPELAPEEEDENNFDENDDQYIVDARFLTRLGPKWSLGAEMGYEFEREEFGNLLVRVQRSLHNAVINFEVEFEEDIFNDDEDFNEEEEDEQEEFRENLTYRVFFEFKLPKEDFVEIQPIATSLRGYRFEEEESVGLGLNL